MIDRPALRLGIAGLGRIATDYLSVLEHRCDLDVVRVFDVDASRAHAVADATGATACSEARELLGDDVDAVAVLTPPNTHEELAIAAIQNGRHAFCEKPLALNSGSARRMLRAAERFDRVLMMATKFRFVPAVARARELVADGAIGAPISYWNAFTASVDMTGRWNSDARVAGGGVLIDNGTHAVDLARFVLGTPIAAVNATFQRRVQPIEVEDSVLVVFEAAGGAVGEIHLSWSLDPGYANYVRVLGTDGVIELGWRGSRWRRNGEDWQSFGDDDGAYDKRVAFDAQLAHFAAAVRGDERPTVTATDAQASVDFVEAAYRSAMDRTWITVRAT